MRTSKPIATISYNTEDFLNLKLDDLMKSHIIDSYAYIYHIPEEDEQKGHVHLYIEPAQMLQTSEFRDLFDELDLSNKKPLGVQPFVSSKFDDWYLYVLHDKAYLASKGQSRKYHYEMINLVFSDDEYYHEKIRRVNVLALSPYQAMIDIMNAGGSFGEFVKSGRIPINLLKQYESAWCYLCEDKTFRADHKNHEEKEG